MLDGLPRAIEKRGPPAALAREAEALRLLAGRPWVPRLLVHAPGRLVAELLPGAPRRLAATGAPELRALGRVLRDLHDLHAGASGGPPEWPTPAETLDGYRRLRARDALRALGPMAQASLGRSLAAVATDATTVPGPFRLLHGDLVESNILWWEGAPALVDWEFWRTGDPAEDLAYLYELNRLDGAGAAAVVEGYGPARAHRRVDSWRTIVVADAAAWYAARGDDEEARVLRARAEVLAAGRR